MKIEYKDLLGRWNFSLFEKDFYIVLNEDGSFESNYQAQALDENELRRGEFSFDEERLVLHENDQKQLFFLAKMEKMRWGVKMVATNETEEGSGQKLIWKKYTSLEKVPLFSKINPPPRTKQQMSLQKRIAFYGVFASLAIIMAVIERMFPIPIPIPGIKLGLANVIVILVLYTFNARSAFAIALLRIFVVAMLFGGTGLNMMYSLVGGLLSFAVMVAAKRSKLFGVVGVSVFGGVAHNMGQITVAVLVLNTVNIYTWSPALIIAGVITGIVIGFTAGFASNNIKILQKM